MKSIFAIKKDILLRLIAASLYYEKDITLGFRGTDLVIDGHTFVEIEKCGYIIRVPVSDIPKVDYSSFELALVEVTPIHIDAESLPKIDFTQDIYEVHIKVFTTSVLDAFANGNMDLSDVTVDPLSISNDLPTEDGLQANILRIISHCILEDVVLEDETVIAPSTVKGIFLKSLVDIIGNVNNGRSNVLGFHIAQDGVIDAVIDLQLSEAGKNTIYLLDDICIELKNEIGNLPVLSFTIYEKGIDVGLSCEGIILYKFRYMPLSDSVNIDISVGYIRKRIRTITAVNDVEITDSCLMSVNCSTTFLDFSEKCFEDIGTYKFSEILRKVV